ncbi:Cys-tRNA(Pro) deacylase [Phenylobacterium sp.]|jgi:Cys-tRNA(Pro)/Cys-tRNA(Cys) deacylase|uniref:Cys-tRNA(Pro) deacylase n=1 Tax=Phenylobacterium sp. TaxID=1871053 RepID=UPI000C8D4DB7|nr:Cys-tRNA(Pro) deacylase [Phenylobacterium sp.]MAK82302.1 Cys-tRNA(Pro) deacylase [Phenylobacterium sp.]|tara:strand:+ start:7313 stop:7783 length:471 start_codon:yes stop_codon:yes gene_type:complete
MSRATPATQVLDRAGVPYALHVYDYAPAPGRIGLQAAAGLGVDPGQVLKTLMVLVDGRGLCAILPSDREASLKQLARAVGGKAAQMMAPAAAERATGYKIGGVSPFGQRKPAPVLVEASALDHAQVFVNGGQRGLQIRLAPRDLIAVLDAQTAVFA